MQAAAALAEPSADCVTNHGEFARKLKSAIGHGRRKNVIAAEHNLIQKSDTGEIESLVDEVIAANAKAVQEIVSGGKKSKKALSFLLGQVMQKSKGQANPKIVSEILNKKLA